MIRARIIARYILAILVVVLSIKLFVPSELLSVQKISELLRQSSPWLLMLSFPGYALLYWIRIERIIKISKPLKFSRLELYQLVAYHNWWNILLPARTGELTFVVLFKKKGVGFSTAMLWLLSMRMLDFCLPLSVIGIVFVFNWAGLWATLLIVSLTVLLAICALPRLRSWIPPLSSDLRDDAEVTENSKGQRFLAWLGGAVDLILSRRGLWILIDSIFIYLIISFIFWSYFLALSTPVSFWQALLGGSYAVAALIVPLNAPGNVGTIDIGWLFGFSQVGVNPSATVAAAFLMHLFMVFNALLHVALAALLNQRSVAS